MKVELGRKILTNFFGLEAKTYSYLKVDDSEYKQPKHTKKCGMKIKFKLKKKLKYKINIQKKIKLTLIRNNKSILKTQQRLKSRKHNVFTEEINKIALSSNDDKRIQSIDSIETYASETSKDVVIEKEVIKCNNIMKRYKNI